VNPATHLYCRDKKTSWQELCLSAAECFGEPAQFKRQRVFFTVNNALRACESLAYGIMHDLDFGIIDQARLNESLREDLASQGILMYDSENNICKMPNSESGKFLPGRITVLTSGTTGRAKLIAHSLASLNSFTRVNNLPSNCWYVPYQLGSYAWYQMVMMSRCVNGQDLALPSNQDTFSGFSDSLAHGHSTAISCTPTFWRQAWLSLDTEILASAPLRYISLGGEIVDQPVLDRLRSDYPDSVIRHIYASSEAGAAIVVKDGLAGFPLSYLQQNPTGIALKIEQDVLYVKSPYSHLGASGDWVKSGDRVEVRGDRVYFCGRADDDVINVGGQKAYVSDVEAHLLTHEDVAWVRVRARRAPMVGFLPMASVVLKRAMPEEEAEQLLRRHCEKVLAEYAVPRIWYFMDSVPMQSSLKS
jgi:acyl-coenzyme A synthetase/AMP-(fatty) acid ligase